MSHAGGKVALFFIEPTSYVLSDIHHIRKGLPSYMFDVFLFEQNSAAAVTDCGQFVFHPEQGLVSRAIALLRLLIHLKWNGYRAALIQGYLPWYCTMILLGCWLLQIPTIMASDTQLSGTPTSWKQTVKYPLLRLLLRTSSFFLAAGTRQKAYFMYYGVPESRTLLQHMTVDTVSFRTNVEEARTDRSLLFRQLGLPEGVLVVLFVGRLVPVKGLDYLITAYAAVQQKVSRPLALVLVGAGIEQARLEELARTLQVEVRFPGFQSGDDLKRWYAAAELFVLPSWQEQWGLVINEAMSCALPVVTTTAVGAVDDLVRDGDNGFVVPPRDHERLAWAVERLVSDDGLRTAMGRRSAEIIARWGYPEYVAALAGALKTILGS